MILPANDFAWEGESRTIFGPSRSSADAGLSGLQPQHAFVLQSSAKDTLVARCLLVFLAEPPQTRYDLCFRIGPFHVRVTPFFWVMAIVLGWGLTQSMDRALSEAAGASPGAGVLLVLWISAVFISILIHELGHALAMRYYGMDCYIVLYHFGGIAVPDSAASFAQFGGTARRRDGKSQIIISAAGPAVQLILAAIVLLLCHATGYVCTFRVPLIEWIVPFLVEVPFLPEPQAIPSAAMDAFVFFLLLPSIFWALLNLLPVYPLDGGQIAREVFTMFNPSGGIRSSLILSVVTGVAVAVYAMTREQMYLAIMFGMLAFSSYQILQAYSGRGGYGGRPW